jgi:lipopolysaccharide biosynthesis protein
LDDEIIVAQNHSQEDHANIFHDLLRYIRDDRYVCVDGRPVIVIYRPDIIGDLESLVQIWRDRAAKAGLQGLYLVATNSFGFSSPEQHGFDAICQFPPHGLNVGRIDAGVPRLNAEYWGYVYDYGDVVDAELKKLELGPPSKLPQFPGVMPGWDNEPRRPGRGNVFHHSSPSLFHAWLAGAARHVNEHYPSALRLVFINAWNEWGEGAYLEPDQRYGYAYLAALRRVVEEHGVTPEPLVRLARKYNESGQSRTSDTTACLHVFYTSLIPAFAAIFTQARRTRPMDVIVSIPNTWTEADFDFVVKQLQPIRIIVTENIGRDVWPFFQVLRLGQEMGYTYGCKLHSKMSTHLTDGGAWRSRLVDSLLASAALSALEQAFFHHPRVGLAAAKESFQTLENRDTVLHNLDNMQALMKRLGVMSFEFDEFVAGSMFWFRFAAFEDSVLRSIDRSWFDEELGQIDGTVAHAFERLFVSYARAAGWAVLKY